jgi:hypothetical protein
MLSQTNPERIAYMETPETEVLGAKIANSLDFSYKLLI